MQSWTGLVFFWGALFCATACGGSASDSRQGSAEAGASETGGAVPDVEEVDTSDGDGSTASGPDLALEQPLPVVGAIETRELEGARILVDTVGGVQLQALRTGRLSMIGDCLAIDDSVTVWNASHVERLGEAILAMNAGLEVTVRVSGGGSSRVASGGFASRHASLLEACPADAFWFTGPQAPEFSGY